MVGKTALNKEMKHLNGAYFRTRLFSLNKNCDWIQYHHICIQVGYIFPCINSW